MAESLQNLHTFLLLLLTVGLTDVFGQSDDVFIGQPNVEPYYVRSSEKGPTLPCRVSSKYAEEPYELTWVQISSNGSPRIISTGRTNRYSDHYDLDTTSCAGCYNLQIKAVDYRRDNGKFYCQVQATGQLQLRDSRPAVVIVLVVPDPPAITVEPTGPVTEGDWVQVECQSRGGSPPATLEWFFGNGTKLATGSVRNASDLNSSTVHTVQWRVSAAENGQSLVCRAHNVAMGSNPPMELSTKRVTVFYPPRVTVGPRSFYDLEKGSVASLTCVADANPPPTRYGWQQSGALSSNGWPQQNITFMVAKESAGNYSCSVSNSVGTGYQTLVMNILYGPDINVPGEQKVREGSPLQLTCYVDSNPKPTSITWQGPVVNSDSAYLSIDRVSRADAGNYTCTAKNSLTGSGDVRTAVRSTTVYVLHAPGKGVITVVDKAVVGMQATLTCAALDDAGIPPATFKWKRPGQSQFDESTRQGSTLLIPEVKLSDAGEYSCVPFNEFGNGEMGSAMLFVYEPASLTRLLPADKQMTAGDPEVLLTCDAHGQPAPNITWWKDGEMIHEDDHLSIRQSEDANSCGPDRRCSVKVTGTLRFLTAVKWTDKGLYSCEAFNGAGKRVNSSMNMAVSHAPVVINDPKRPWAGAEPGKSASIECRASANPAPTFRWFHAANDITNSPSHSVTLGKKGGDDVFTSVVTVRSVREEDLGDYKCVANNRMGESTYVFTMQRKTHPLVPTDVREVQKTHQSILLGWVPGYNGGYDQTFTVEMADKDGRLVTSANVSEPVRDDSAPRRNKRYVGVESPRTVTNNFTGLLPLSSYSFRVKAVNSLGESEFTTPVTIKTQDAPVVPGILTPTSALFNSDSGVLEVKPDADPILHCVQVYARRSGDSFEPLACFKPSAHIVLSVTQAESIRLRFCETTTMRCSESIEAQIGKPSGVPLEAIIVPSAIGGVLVLVGIIVVVCCCCRRKNKLPAYETKSTPLAKQNQKKDYEPQQQTPAKVISNPYMPETTLIHSHMAGSKDSGVYTTNGSVVNYNHYDGYAPQDYTSHINHRASSIQDQADGWPEQQQQQYDYNNSGYMHSGYGANEFVDPNAYGQQDDPYGGYNHRPFADMHGNNLVDMNPAGGSQEGSINSGYSTPSSNQRRVIREIIV